MKIPRSLATATLVAAVGVTAGCGGAGRSANLLDELVRTISVSQGVDDAAVLAALRSAAQSEDELVIVARQWADTLPPRPVPDPGRLARALDDGPAQALEEQICAAVADALITGDVPSGEEFVDDYVRGTILQPLPFTDFLDAVQAFDTLAEEAEEGPVTSVQVRLTLLRLQHCP